MGPNQIGTVGPTPIGILTRDTVEAARPIREEFHRMLGPVW